jgi:hypothetical protein
MAVIVTIDQVDSASNEDVPSGIRESAGAASDDDGLLILEDPGRHLFD